jgi:sugar lactone lactonase YvrE
MEAEILYPSGCQLGESPAWHSERESCFWVDIEGRSLHEYKWLEKSLITYQLDYRVSLVIPGKNDEVMLGLQGGIGKFNLESRTLTWVTDLKINWEHLRCNDGICDSKGRLWIGTMAMDFASGAGSVYCIDKNKKIHKRIPKVSISNGMAWSNDNKRLYYIDSLTRRISSFFYKEQSGEIVFEKVALHIPEAMGLPDGMTIDEEGMLWVALWGGFGVGRFNMNTGKRVAFIKVPAPHVSSCSFAGKDLDHLVITTAKEGMTPEDIVKYPESGNVFIVKPGVKGVPAFNCEI